MNRDAEVVSKAEALMVNLTAARGLQNVLKTNLGPRYERRALLLIKYQQAAIHLNSLFDSYISLPLIYFLWNNTFCCFSLP